MTLWRCKQGAFEAPVKAALTAALSDEDSLAFGDGDSLNLVIGGFGKIFFGGVGPGVLNGFVSESVIFMFQMTSAIITPALIVGVYSKGMKIGAVLLYSVPWSIIV